MITHISSIQDEFADKDTSVTFKINKALYNSFKEEMNVHNVHVGDFLERQIRLVTSTSQHNQFRTVLSYYSRAGKESPLASEPTIERLLVDFNAQYMHSIQFLCYLTEEAGVSYATTTPGEEMITSTVWKPFQRLHTVSLENERLLVDGIWMNNPDSPYRGSFIVFFTPFAIPIGHISQADQDKRTQELEEYINGRVAADMSLEELEAESARQRAEDVERKHTHIQEQLLHGGQADQLTKPNKQS